MRDRLPLNQNMPMLISGYQLSFADAQTLLERHTSEKKAVEFARREARTAAIERNKEVTLCILAKICMNIFLLYSS